MRNANRGTDPPLIPFKLIEDEPLVSELPWDEWDLALARLEAETADGRAMRLALMEMPA